MAKFLKKTDLNNEIEKIFQNARVTLIIISPYIKLHHRIKDELKSHLKNYDLLIIVVFGKNENDYSKSLPIEDFNFLKQFPNIDIKYESRLHAKYYANENSQIITSMNLYDFSQNENIEVGVLTEYSILNKLTGNSVDTDAWEYFYKVVENSTLLFRNVPEYEKKLFGKTFLGILNELDELSRVYEKQGLNETKKPTKTNSFNSQSNSTDKVGYCIRTGEKIPFNMKKPFSEKAFESWSKYKDETYKEKFCHFSGEKSNGETCFSKPVLAKYYKEALLSLKSA